MARDEGGRHRHVAMGERDARIRQDTGRGRHSRHHLEADAGVAQGDGLLAAAAEDVGIAAFQSYDATPRTGLADEAGVQLILPVAWPVRLPATTVAGVDALTVVAGEIEQAWIQQIVIEDDVSLGQQAGPLHRDQAGITWTGADDVDAASSSGLGGHDSQRPRVRISRCTQRGWLWLPRP